MSLYAQIWEANGVVTFSDERAQGWDNFDGLTVIEGWRKKPRVYAYWLPVKREDRFYDVSSV